MRGNLPVFVVSLWKVRYEPPAQSTVFLSRSALGGSGQVFGAVHFEGLVVVLQISASQSLLIMSYQISAVKQAVFQVYVKSSHTYSISSFIFYLRC